MTSEYEELFGESLPGRPSPDIATGAVTGDKKLTERARRRATRVLKNRHALEFEELMEAEIAYLRISEETLPKGVQNQ